VPAAETRSGEVLGSLKHGAYVQRIGRNSRAFLAVVQAQDILGLGSESRMNTPATVGENWRWRATEGSFTATLVNELRNEMAACKRINGGA